MLTEEVLRAKQEEEEEEEEEEDEKLTFVAGMLAASVCEARVDRTVVASVRSEGRRKQ